MLDNTYMMAVLNGRADILDFKCTLYNAKLKLEDIYRKNWFNIFVEKGEEDIYQENFDKVLENCKMNYFQADVICFDNTHRYVDFQSACFEKQRQKYIFLVGMEHHSSNDFDLTATFLNLKKRYIDSNSHESL